MANQCANGGYYTNLLVYPKNWNTKRASVKKPWRISYRYYSPTGSKKQVTIGVGKFDNLTHRQDYTRELIAEEIRMLDAGYNPITQQIEKLDPQMYSGSWEDAMWWGVAQMKQAESTMEDVRTSLRNVIKAAKALHFAHYPLEQITKKELKVILNKSAKSASMFNRQRLNLSMIYNELEDFVDINYPKLLRRQKETRTDREILSVDERQAIHAHLQKNHPDFLRFVHLFYHSGCRFTELISVVRSEVDVARQRFMVTVRKGRVVRKMWRPMKTIAVPLWEEQLRLPGKFVFGSDEGRPADKQMDRRRPAKLWYRLVKEPLGVTADFYSLKHLHTTDVLNAGFKDEEAAEWNAHTSTAMVRTIYDRGREEREAKTIKELKNTFAR